ncbi:MAG: RAMP superfamily CRISPR-associated protein [Bacteroidales bacterium]
MIEIFYTIKPISPLRIGTGIGKAGYLDNTVVRDSYGQPFIPGSTIKGKVRATAFRLAKTLEIKTPHSASETSGCLADGRPPCDICRIFGAPQIPGDLYFNNAVLQTDIQKVISQLDKDRRKENRSSLAAEGYGQNIRTNNAIDRKTQTTLVDHLFSFEAVGDPLVFSGQIEGGRKASITKYDAAVLVAILQFTTHLGGTRGRGLGRCEITVDEARVDGCSIMTELKTLLEHPEGK